jgi:hypothetical protein
LRNRSRSASCAWRPDSTSSAMTPAGARLSEKGAKTPRPWYHCGTTRGGLSAVSGNSWSSRRPLRARSAACHAHWKVSADRSERLRDARWTGGRLDPPARHRVFGLGPYVTLPLGGHVEAVRAGQWRPSLTN